MKIFSFFKNAEKIDVHSEMHLLTVQNKLLANRIDLNARPQLAESQSINEEALAIYLNSFKSDTHRSVAEKLIRQQLRKLTMQELQDRLAACMIPLNSAIQGEYYSVIVETGHSSQWVTELALRHLNTLPSHVVRIGPQYAFSTTNLTRCKNLVLIDDCAYSGTQMAKRILPNLFKALSSSDDNNHYDLTIIFAFMTTYAKSAILTSLENLQTHYSHTVDITLTLLHGEIIPTINELPIEEDDKLATREILDFNSYVDLDRFVLTWADWKIPDFMSFPSRIADATLKGELSKYNGLLIADLPADVRNAQPFIPEPKRPYGHDEVRYGY